MRALIGLIITILCATFLGAADYEAVHVRGGDWFLVFPAPARLHAFVDYRLAIEIVSIECDGRNVAPEIINGDFHFNHAEYSNVNNAIIYSCHWSMVKSAIWQSGKVFEGSIRAFSVPQQTGILCVTYRVHYPNGEVSEEYTVVSKDMVLLEKKE